MIRLIAFDLDGTVLSETGQASAASVKAIQDVLEAGILAASVSGRNVTKSQEPFGALAKLFYVTSYNGAIVLDAEKEGHRSVIHEQRVAVEELKEIAGVIRSRDMNFVYADCDVTDGKVREDYITNRDSPSIQNLGEMTEIRFVFDVDLAAGVEKGIYGPPPKLILMPGVEKRDHTFEEVKERFGSRLYFVRTGDDRIEVMHPEVNKGLALRMVCERIGISSEEVFAIGDGENDLPLLEAAGKKVLMGNADEATAAAAKRMEIETTAPFEDEGFAKAIDRHVLSRPDFPPLGKGG